MTMPIWRILSSEIQRASFRAPTRREIDSIKRINFTTHLISLGCCLVGSQLTEKSIVWIVPAFFLSGNYFLLDAFLKHFETIDLTYLHVEAEIIEL